MALPPPDKPKRTPKRRPKPVATGSRGDSGRGVDKPTPRPKAPGPPKFAKQIPVRPGAPTPRHATKPSTQAQRTHVHEVRAERGRLIKKKPNFPTNTKPLKRPLPEGVPENQRDLYERDPKKLKAAGFKVDLADKVVQNIGKDIYTYPGQAVSSAYAVGSGAYEAARGRPEKIQKVWKGVKQSDPVYNLAAAGVEKVKGNDKAASSHLHKVGKAFEEHPLLSTAEVTGVGRGVVGGAGGRLARTGALGKTAKKAGSTERVTKTVEGTDLKETQRYSKNLVDKGVQVGAEKFKAARARRKEAFGEPQPPTTRMSDTEIKRRVDERIAVNEDLRRAHRAKVTHEAHQATKGAKHEGVATTLVAQRIAHADHGDLRAYADELAGQYESLKPHEKRANKDLRSAIGEVVDNPKTNLSRASAAAERYHQVIAPREAKLREHGLLAGDQMERAALIPYAVRRMGAKHEPEHWVDGEGAKVPKSEVNSVRAANPKAVDQLYTKVPARLVDHEGKKLSTKAIQEHMGGDEPTFITQSTRGRGAGSFNVRSERAPQASYGRRTGEATRKGLFDAHPDTLIENAARVQGLVDAAEGFKGIVGEFGVKDKGKLVTRNTRAEIDQIAKEMMFDEHGDPVAGAHKMVAVRVNPFGGSREQLHQLLDDTHGDEIVGPHSPIREAIQSAIRGHEGEGPWALVPEAAAKRVNEHMNTMGSTTFEKAFQATTGQFRRTVLSTAPTWPTGNVLEASLRSAVARAGPMSYRRGRAALKRLEEVDTQLAEEASHRIAGGGHLSTAERMQIKRTAEQFEGTKLAPVANALGKAVRAPGARTVSKAWGEYTRHVFGFNAYLERQFQTAMLGRALHNEGLKAVEDAVNGLKGTEAQVHFGRTVDKMYGQYSKWSPSTRKVIANYTPFVAWWLAAAKFVFHTLPKDHPVLTSLIASSEMATEEWRREHKLDLDQLGLKAGFLAGSIPLSGGRHLRLARFTPFGAFTDPLSVVDVVLPQFSTIFAAGRGQDWKGHDFKSFSEGITTVARDLGGAYIPFLSRGLATKEKGPNQALNPFKPVAPQKTRARKLAPAKPAMGYRDELKNLGRDAASAPDYRKELQGVTP